MHGLDTIRKLNEALSSKKVGDDVKIIAYREHGWMDEKTDFRQWDQLCRAYGVQLQLIREWKDAEVPKGYKVVLLEGAGDVSITDFKHPEKAVYVFGRSLLNLFNRVDEYDVSVNIPTPESIPMFGVTAGGIVLQDRFEKS